MSPRYREITHFGIDRKIDVTFIVVVVVDVDDDENL